MISHLKTTGNHIITPNSADDSPINTRISPNISLESPKKSPKTPNFKQKEGILIQFRELFGKIKDLDWILIYFKDLLEILIKLREI